MPVFAAHEQGVEGLARAGAPGVARAGAGLVALGEGPRQARAQEVAVGVPIGAADGQGVGGLAQAGVVRRSGGGQGGQPAQVKGQG